MKHMIMSLALAALISLLAGCTSSTRIEWGGKMAVRQPDGTVLVDANGTPHYESEKNVYKDSNWLTKREERDVRVKVNSDGSYEAGIGSRVNDISTNGIAMVTGGVNSLTRLVSTCAAAYVTIAGGGAQADTATALATKLVSYFISQGGDADKATVSADSAAGALTVTDGKTSVQCKDGSCSTLQN